MKPITALAFFASIAMAIQPFPSYASTLELDAAVTRAALSKDRSTPQRKALAQLMVAYWKSFDSRIPRTPPPPKNG
ncbi:hypothetical protein ACU8V1_13965 [Rhizobium leguminosarum]